MSSGGDRLFLPWARRGLSGALTAPATGATPARGTLSVNVTLNTGRKASDLSPETPIEVAGLHMMGPGDVAGLGPQTVRATLPPHGTLDMFPNQIPAVEFDAPDLPWMFTPFGPSNDRLTPWIALVCIEAGTEGTLNTEQDGTVGLTVTPPEGQSLAGWQGVLPDLEEAWAWAHVQVSGVDADTILSSEALEARLEAGAGVISRLVCPRNLRPETEYFCAIVPVFAAGREAGLGTEASDATGFAWTVSDTGPLTLPVYHHWSFRTAKAGDFEALARLLEPRAAGSQVGRRAIDIQRPGVQTDLMAQVIRPPASDTGDVRAEGARLGLPFPLIATAAEPTAHIGGALQPIGATTEPIDPLGPALTEAMQDPVTELPVIGPPAYGRWAAGRKRRGIGGLGPDQEWLRKLATTTRFRAAAGAGAEVVRRNQDVFMAEIWSQFGAVEQINGLLARAQLSRVVGRRLSARHLELDTALCPAVDQAPPARIWDTLAPVADRVSFAGRTASWAAGQGPEARTGPALRRAATTAPNGTGTLEARANRMRSVLDNVLPDNDPADDDRDTAAARAAFETAIGSVPAADLRKALLPEPDWMDVRNALCAGLDPDRTQVARAQGRLGNGVALHQPTDDPLHPVAAAPSLPRPLMIDLQDLAQDLILPGLDHVPQNSLNLLKPDQAFIEAFMAGANHEISAEMLWRGFPTDRASTPFRHFWDRRGTNRVDHDITPMREWRGALGSNSVTPDDPLVLLIRGDLLNRFPQTLIYALAADPGDAGVLGDAEPRLPIFRGGMSPDVTFLGFDLSVDEVFSDEGRGGFFFVIEGPPTEPRFGLDATLRFDAQDFGRNVPTLSFDADAPWETFYWGDLIDPDVPDAVAALADLTHIPVTLPTTADGRRNPTLRGTDHHNIRWGANAAHMAAITLQLDTRVAIHADALLGDDDT